MNKALNWVVLKGGDNEWFTKRSIRSLRNFAFQMVVIAIYRVMVKSYELIIFARKF